MATSAVLRVILGENSSQRVVLPDTVTELENEIRRQCQLQDLFRLQFMDELSGNIFQDLTSMEKYKTELQSKCCPSDLLLLGAVTMAH
ncbi:Reticulon-4 receptor-like 2 [Dissostichus eleginoides]|uniref:Reticulon-4 receptor-like 2 n=1 Tax=Dissostichus eleginoides TaxID=100907 RepID=A0AAD9CWD1_DISEL|nr:Reticulon-4 receptor-like 2 [Dissostichus eleginoides]